MLVNAACQSPATPEQMVGAALEAMRSGDEALREVLDPLPAPIYVTDADGWVTYYNEACVRFAGRTPEPGTDRWCVTWKLYREDGTPLPHERCPMATAVREGRKVRGMMAVAERPDGSRVLFLPHPTPLLDEDGRVAGAVNLLIDVTDSRQAAELRGEAARCRRLAGAVGDPHTVETLRRMAAEYDEKAVALDSADPPDSPSAAPARAAPEHPAG